MVHNHRAVGGHLVDSLMDLCQFGTVVAIIGIDVGLVDGEIDICRSIVMTDAVGMCLEARRSDKTGRHTGLLRELGRDAVRIASVEYVYSFLASMLPRITGMKFQM